VLIGVSPARMFAMLASVGGMTMRAMGVMSRLFMGSSFVMLCSLAVVASSVRVVFGSGAVVLGCLF